MQLDQATVYHLFSAMRKNIQSVFKVLDSMPAEVPSDYWSRKGRKQKVYSTGGQVWGLVGLTPGPGS